MNDKVIAKQATIIPITLVDTARVAEFLHQHMNDQFTSDVWQKGISKSWLADTPNYGFMLIHNEQIVGVLCAVYSEQYVSGKLEAFCNPHSWCVLPTFRSRSVDLVLAVIRQQGFHFTMLSPNQEGVVIFQFLKFKPLNNQVSILLNFPALNTRSIKLTEDKQVAQQLLPQQSQKYYADHLAFPWLKLLVYGVDNQYGFIIFKKQQYKRLGCAMILYISDAALFHQCWSAIRSYLLFQYGMFSSKIETRLLGQQPIKTWIKPEQGGEKFYLSNQLSVEDVHYVYSELVTLDL